MHAQFINYTQLLNYGKWKNNNSCMLVTVSLCSQYQRPTSSDGMHNNSDVCPERRWSVTSPYMNRMLALGFRLPL